MMGYGKVQHRDPSTCLPSSSAIYERLCFSAHHDFFVQRIAQTFASCVKALRAGQASYTPRELGRHCTVHSVLYFRNQNNNADNNAEYQTPMGATHQLRAWPFLPGKSGRWLRRGADAHALRGVRPVTLGQTI